MTQLLTLSSPAPRPRPHPLEVHPPDPTSGLISLIPASCPVHFPSIPFLQTQQEVAFERMAGPQTPSLLPTDSTACPAVLWCVCPDHNPPNTWSGLGLTPPFPPQESRPKRVLCRV